MGGKFTFHYGSIQIECAVNIIDDIPDLHSTMVLFKYKICNGTGMEEKFTFHYGSIQILIYWLINILWEDLHSTMVLFKSKAYEHEYLGIPVFTFHYGSIQMDSSIIISNLTPEFTFHYGSIQIKST